MRLSDVTERRQGVYRWLTRQGASVFEIDTAANQVRIPSGGSLVGAGGSSADTRISHAEILTLAATPQILVPAPGAGLALRPLGMYVVVDTQAGAYTGSNFINICYSGNLAAGLMASQISTQMNTAALTIRAVLPGTANTVRPNEALVAHNGNVEWTGGNAANTVSIHLRYETLAAVAFES